MNVGPLLFLWCYYCTDDGNEESNEQELNNLSEENELNNLREENERLKTRVDQLMQCQETEQAGSSGKNKQNQESKLVNLIDKKLGDGFNQIHSNLEKLISSQGSLGPLCPLTLWFFCNFFHHKSSQNVIISFHFKILINLCFLGVSVGFWRKSDSRIREEFSN